MGQMKGDRLLIPFVKLHNFSPEGFANFSTKLKNNPHEGSGFPPINQHPGTFRVC
jgi:hypothetical protein